MKPIFGIDITLTKKNEVVNGNEFIIKTVSKQKMDKFDAKQENLKKTVEQSKLPLWIRIVQSLCCFWGVIVFAGTMNALGDVTLTQAFQNAPVLLVSGIACGVIWGVLHFWAKSKEKRMLTEQDAEHQVAKIDIDINAMYDELGVPHNAYYVDVLSFRYKVKNDKITATAVGFQTTPYINFDLRMYITDDHLYLANIENLYAFKLSDLKTIKTVNKRISIPTWNKQEEPTKGEFKQYKLAVNNLGDIFFKPYYILEGEHNGETFGIYFPPYELATFEKLTGLSATK